MSEYSLKKQGEMDGRREKEREVGERKIRWNQNDMGSCRKKSQHPRDLKIFFLLNKLGMEKYAYVI